MDHTYLIIVVFSSIAKGNILNTAQGALRGSLSEDGSYMSYNGIPYAGDPKSNKFKKAPPPFIWHGIREASDERPVCLSASDGGLQGDEDCLLLNVHVPTSTDQPIGSLKPVLVWIHGGGFQSGSASPSIYGPRLLMKRGIIFVGVNYRLGPVGFLCLGHEKVPGNAGVKDVVLALRWVRDNIIAFGGDSARVTIAGSSSGAAIVESLILSPTTEGLIHRAIMQSGTALNTWAYNYDAQSRAEALVRYFTNSSQLNEMAEKLVATKSGELVMKSRNLEFAYFPFSLCSEKEYKKEERFLSSHPIDILKNKKFKPLSLLIGYNSNEAYILASTLMNAKVSKIAQRDLSLLLPQELVFSNKNEMLQTASRIQKTYFQDSNFSMDKLLEYYTDGHFVSPIHRSVKLHTAASDLPLYFYEFNYSGKLGLQSMNGAMKRGAAHSDELAYLFSEDDVEIDDDDKTIQEVMTTLWTNFVKYGNPTPELTSIIPTTWEPVKSKDVRLFSIGMKLEMRSFQNEGRAKIWEDIIEKHYYQRAGST